MPLGSVYSLKRYSRKLPTPQADGQTPQDVGDRADIYGAPIVTPLFSSKYPLIDESSQFTCGSGFGTSVAQQAQITAFSDTGPLWVINNKATPSPTATRLYLDSLRLMLYGTAPTGTVSLELAVQVDIQSFSKLPTNSNQYTNPTIYNPNSDDTTRTSQAVVYAYLAANALVTPGSSGGVRKASRMRLPTGQAVVGDQYVFRFGGTEASNTSGLTAARATHPASFEVSGDGVIIGAGCWATIHLWWLTATTLPTWEWDLTWFER